MRDIEVVAQAQLGGHTIALTATVPFDQRDIDETLDLMARRFDRQRAIEQLPEAMVDLLAAQKALETLPQRERDKMRERAEERIRLQEQMEAQHLEAGRRGPFKLSASQKQGLRAFDEETQKRRDEFKKEAAAHEAAIPALKERIARLEARIAGGDKTEPLREEMKAAADD